MKNLSGVQKQYLKGLAHKLNPSAFVGQKGVTDSLIKEISSGLDANELIKVKFLDFKDKNIKNELAEDIAVKSGSYLLSMIGHAAIYYKRNKNTEKSKIILPL